jgi:hypothetical protein
MDSVALALFRFFSRTRQKAGAAVRAPGAAPHPHPHPHECNYGALGQSGQTIPVTPKASIMKLLCFDVIWVVLIVAVTVMITQRCIIHTTNMLMWILSAAQAAWLITIIFIVLQHTSSIAESIAHTQEQRRHTAFHSWMSMHEIHEFSGCCLIWKP